MAVAVAVVEFTALEGEWRGVMALCGWVVAMWLSAVCAWFWGDLFWVCRRGYGE